MGCKLPVCKENTFFASRKRKEIVRMRSQNTASSTISDLLSTSTWEDYSYHSFHALPSQYTIILSSPIARYPVPSMVKTIARLGRGLSISPIDAMSGWAHIPSCRELINQVFEISALIRHAPKSACERDQGYPCQWNASHVKKKLVA